MSREYLSRSNKTQNVKIVVAKEQQLELICPTATDSFDEVKTVSKRQHQIRTRNNLFIASS